VCFFFPGFVGWRRMVARRRSAGDEHGGRRNPLPSYHIVSPGNRRRAGGLPRTALAALVLACQASLSASVCAAGGECGSPPAAAGSAWRGRALRLRGGQKEDQFTQDTSAAIYSGQMPQDISEEDADQHLIDALSTRNHVIEHADATELEKTVKETIREAKIQDGSLPNPRYQGLTAEEERQLELDELLWFAAEQGEVGLAIEALQAGANVSSTNPEFYNQTALHCASQFQAGHPRILEVLVQHGADVNARNCYNNTALHEAAYWGKDGQSACAPCLRR
jgi:hypothetical protein